MPLQPARHVGFSSWQQTRRHTCLAKIFLREDVASNLAPACGHLNVFKLENQRAAIEIEVRGSFEEKIQAEIDKQFTALLKGQNNDFTERKNPDKRKR